MFHWCLLDRNNRARWGLTGIENLPCIAQNFLFRWDPNIQQKNAKMVGNKSEPPSRQFIHKYLCRRQIDVDRSAKAFEVIFAIIRDQQSIKALLGDWPVLYVFSTRIETCR